MTTETFGRALPHGWNTVDSDVALEIACHEAIIRQAYKDSVGVWTWSVGLTNATGHNVERYIGKPQPLQHCLAVYAWALGKYAADVLEAFDGHPLTKAQFAGALSFHWNTGAIKKATWVNRFKAGDMAGAREAFLWYNQPASILGRRTKECALFFDGKWCNNGTVTEYTRLTSKSTPDWSSARRIDITRDLKAALGEIAPPPPDIEPAEPGAVEPPSPAALAAMAALIAALIAVAALLGIDEKTLKGLMP